MYWFCLSLPFFFLFTYSVLYFKIKNMFLTWQYLSIYIPKHFLFFILLSVKRILFFSLVISLSLKKFLFFRFPFNFLRNVCIIIFHIENYILSQSSGYFARGKEWKKSSSCIQYLFFRLVKYISPQVLTQFFMFFKVNWRNELK